MRKLFAGLASLALMAAPLPIANVSALQAAPSGPGVNQEVLDYCYDLIEQFPGVPLGVCMSFNLTQNTYGWLPQVCAYFEDSGLLEDYGFTSFTDCVRNAR
jgi:hypothetical protein